MRHFIILTALIFVCFLAACAPKTMVVLIPDDDGSVGRVTVASSRNEQVLTQTGTYVEVSDKVGPVKNIDASTMDRVFGPALAARTPEPMSFLLYFQTGASLPDQTSMDLLSEIVQVINTWPEPQVSIIGHTDTMGDRNINNRLSLARAETVRNLLIDAGVPTGIMIIRAHGQNDPLVPTGPNVSEPRNRRVEIFVR
jgi:outer membrane protein OmpA-like peptidoglycan-associated protein